LSGTFEQALEQVDRFSTAIGADPAGALKFDNFEQLAYRWQITDIGAALRSVAGLLQTGASLKLRLIVEETELTLQADRADRWYSASSPDPSGYLEHLRDAGAKVSRTTAELLRGDADSGFGAVESAEMSAEFSKQGWADEIAAETGRSVWIGLSSASFATWLAETDVGQIARRLFAKPGALVLLADWPVPKAVSAGSRLRIGSLAERPAGASDNALLTRRLDERKESANLPSWRLLEVDAQPGVVPADLQRLLKQAVGITAASLIAVREDGVFRPAADQETQWKLPSTPGTEDADVDAIVGLARWVGADLSEIRFTVARDLAGRRIPDPLQGSPAEPLLDAARIAYRLSVRTDVIESLERQQQLEESFRDLDDRAAAMRASIDDTVDGTVTKALAGALAIAIAALTSAKVRDWPATIAAFVLAGYLGATAIGLARWRRDDADARLRDAGALAAQRVEKLGARLLKSTEDWRRQLQTRVGRAIAILWTLAVLLSVGGLLSNSAVRRFVGLEHEAKVTHKTESSPQRRRAAAAASEAPRRVVRGDTSRR
jgi:hypothetical protein